MTRSGDLQGASEHRPPLQADSVEPGRGSTGERKPRVTGSLVEARRVRKGEERLTCSSRSHPAYRRL